MINKNLFICLFIGFTVLRCAKEDISDSKTLDPLGNPQLFPLTDYYV